MRFLDLYISGFGKFHDTAVSFEDGLNVIYGKNEAGKSTIHTFIRGMLFGIERQRGRAARNDIYSKYEPWENSDCIETVAYEYLRYRARRRPVFTGGYRGWHRSDDRARLRSLDRGSHDPLSESWKKHIQNHRPGAGNTEWLCIFGVRMQDL